MPDRPIPPERLAAFTAACLEKLGLAGADARLVAETLVAAIVIALNVKLLIDFVTG